MAIKYDDFDLQIEPAGEKYRVRLLNAPTGQATSEFVLPFTEIEVGNFLNRIGQVRRTMRRVDSPELQAAKEFGGKLFGAVFSGEMIAQLRGSMEQASDKEHGLRIRLRLTDVPALADLPWEFLYDANQNHFLTTSTETPVVRFLDLPQRIAPLRVALPLRVLVMIASPRNLKRLDTEGEWERLQDSLADLLNGGQIRLERLPEATLDALRLRARGAPFHVFHFIGHGGFDDAAQDGVLQFEDETGMSYPVRGEMLGMQLHDHRSLRLAVLNACEGARSSRQDPFSGVAQSLLQQRVPAVIAMQFEISDAAAKVFAAEFYRAVAEGNPVDAAVCESRKALFKEEFGQEWATPVLYMRSQEGQLFELQAVAAPSPPGADLSERMRAEAERLAAEKADAERTAAEKAERERAATAEKERQQREKAERERLALARAEAECKAAEKAETERQAAAKAEAERLASEKERLAKENAERGRLARQKEETERRAKEQAAFEQLQREKAEAERRIKDRAALEELQREKAEAERLERESAVTESVALSGGIHKHLLQRAGVWLLMLSIPVLGLTVWLVRANSLRNAELRKAREEALFAKKNAAPEQPHALLPPSEKTESASVAGGPVSPAPVSPSPVSPTPAATPPTENHAPTRIHVGAKVQAAKLVNRVAPTYPPLAAQTRLSGTVRLHVIIAKNGAVQEIDVLSGPPLLVQSATSAVKQWRYTPTRLNGQLVEVETTVEVIYALANSSSILTADKTPPGTAAPPAAGNAPGAASAGPQAVAPAVAVLPANKAPCTFGKIEFSENGNRLVGTVPYTYQGAYPLDAVALRGMAFKQDKQLVSGLTYGQSTLKAASGSAPFSIEGRPALGKKGEASEYLVIAIVVKQTGAIVCSETVPYQRQW